MENEELIKRNQKLLIENQFLKKENARLQEELEIYKSKYSKKSNNFTSNTDNEIKVINNKSLDSSSEIQRRIKIFMKLFRGRNDVYAKRWENKRKGTSGYSPVCSNEWISGVCQKPKLKSTHCNNKAYVPLDEKIIENNLRGNIVIGLYPMLSDETCYFLAIDFDETN